MSKQIYYAYRHIATARESKHYLTPGAAKSALTTLIKATKRCMVRTILRSDYELVTYECIEVAVTQLQ